jgi:hypothetical protein
MSNDNKKPSWKSFKLLNEDLTPLWDTFPLGAKILNMAVPGSNNGDGISSPHFLVNPILFTNRWVTMLFYLSRGYPWGYEHVRLQPFHPLLIQCWNASTLPCLIYYCGKKHRWNLKGILEAV